MFYIYTKYAKIIDARRSARRMAREEAEKTKLLSEKKKAGQMAESFDVGTQAAAHAHRCGTPLVSILFLRF